MSDKQLYKLGAAYIRVSDERQDEYSPASQLKKIREYAEKDGCQIPDEYVFYDDGISGKSARKRDSFNRMIALAKDKSQPFRTIYVWKFSRFARNQEESMVYKNLLRKKGVSVVSVSEPIPEGHYGTLIERIIEWMDEFYLINLGAEVTRGMTEKISRGEPVTAPPFGYRMENKNYIPDEESGAADVVREVFQLYADGMGQRAIAVYLGNKGVRTKYGGMPDNRWIDYMLQNPCYIGKLRWSTDGTKAVSKRDYENESIITIDGHHKPIITPEFWDKAQERIAEQKKRYRKYARREQPAEYMLKSLIHCDTCGGTISLASLKSGKNRVNTMQCCNYSRGICHVSHSVTMPKLETAFINGLEEALKTNKFNIAPAPKKQDDGVDYDKLIAVERRRLARAQEAYLAEIDTLEQYSANKKEITSKIEDLKNKQQQSAAEAFDIETFRKKLTYVVEFLKKSDVSEQAKNEALRSIIDKAIYSKSTETLTITFLPQ